MPKFGVVPIEVRAPRSSSIVEGDLALNGLRVAARVELDFILVLQGFALDSSSSLLGLCRESCFVY